MNIKDFPKRLRIHGSEVVHATTERSGTYDYTTTLCGMLYSLQKKHPILFIGKKDVPPTMLPETEVVTCKNCLRKLNPVIPTREEKCMRYALKYKPTGHYYRTGPIGKNCKCISNVLDCWLFRDRKTAEIAGSTALHEHKSSKIKFTYNEYALLSRETKKECKYVYMFNSELFEIEKIFLSAKVMKK